MTIKKESSRIFLLNLFADFIVSKIPQQEESIINIVDCKNFILVKGVTTSKELLNLSELTTEFLTKYSKYSEKNKITHTIDLIEYDKNLKPIVSLTTTYHNSDNCSYHPKQIDHYENKESSCDFIHNLKEIDDDSLVLSSEFPHGYSLGQGRLLYYYGKHIFYNIPPNYPVKTLSFTLSTIKDETNFPIFSAYNNYSETDDSVINSWVLDNFDFDMSWLSNEIKKVDWSFELLNPLSDYDFLKKRNKDFVII